MANYYFKARTKWQKAFDQLDDAEVGRLMRAVFEYALTGEVSTPMTGSERILLPIIIADLDDDCDGQADLSEKRKEAARKRWTKSEKCESVPPVMQNASASFASDSDMQNASACNNSNSNSNSNRHRQNTEPETESNTRAREDTAAGFVSDDSAKEIQGEHDQIIQAAEDGGFPGNNATRARILDLFAKYGKERILYGIGECVKHGASNLAYLEKVCQGGPKKKPPASPPAKIVVAQQYEQRDYSGDTEDADSMLDMLKMRST